MGVCQQHALVRANSQLRYQARGHGHSRGRRETRILRGIASDARAGAPFLAPGDITKSAARGGCAWRSSAASEPPAGACACLAPSCARHSC
jgi:hypothetical protein